MQQRPLRSTLIGIVAAKPSSDQLAAHLMRSLQARCPDVQFVGIGGPKMEAAGAEILHPMESIAEPDGRQRLRRTWALGALRRELRERYLRGAAALFVGVDAPDFNLELAYDLKRAGMSTVQYIAPAGASAAREDIQRVKHSVSLLLTAYPFEGRAFSEAGVPVTFVGHPLADLLADLPPMETVREELRVAQSVPVLAMLPGSRPRDVEEIGELFLRTAVKLTEQFPETRFLVPFVTRETRLVFETVVARVQPEALNLTTMIGHSLEAMAAADAVLVPPGTAALEAALLKRPMVITSRAMPRHWWTLKRRTGTACVGLPNVLAGDAIVPELAYEDATPEKLCEALLALFADENARLRLDVRFEAIRSALRQNTHEKAAAALMPLLARVRAA